MDNVITNVNYEEAEGFDDDAKLFVFYDRPEFDQVIEADEGWGNGYYGGGFYISILSIEQEE